MRPRERFGRWRDAATVIACVLTVAAVAVGVVAWLLRDLSIKILGEPFGAWQAFGLAALLWLIGLTPWFLLIWREEREVRRRRRQ